MRELCQLTGVDQHRTSPYHPQCNGIIERMHGTLEPMLRNAADVDGNWVAQLSYGLFALRSLPHRDTQLSPFRLFYGWMNEGAFKHNVTDWVDVFKRE